jgi:hypothetical protein
MASLGPRARTSRLVTRDLGDELLIYDLERHKAYCLNRVAMQVYRLCDGETTIPDMALRIGNALGMPVDERAVRLGLVRLERAHLLDRPVAQILHVSRREMLSTLGRAAAVVGPVVTAITVPTSAQAQATGCINNSSQPCDGRPCCPPRFCCPPGTNGAGRCSGVTGGCG